MEVPTWIVDLVENRIYLASIMAIVTSMLIILVLNNVAIDPYIKATKWGVNLFEFYENNDDGNKIYFIGDSLPQWAIDSMIVEDYLNNKTHLTVGDFYDPEMWSGTLTYWMQADSTILINSPENHTAILSLRAASFYRNRTLVISSSGVPAAQVTVVPMSFINVSVPIYLAKGANTVRFHVPEGCERPSDIIELNNPDNRCLSVVIQNITLSKRESDQLDYNKNNNQSFKVYNLAHSGDNPKTRIIELPYIAKSKPKIAVFCLQYRLFSGLYSWDPSAIEDRFALSAKKIMLDPYAKSFFNKKDLDLIQMDSMHLIAYKRMLLMPCLQLKLSKTPPFSEMPFITPPPARTEDGIKPNFKVDFIPPKTTIAPKENLPAITISEKPTTQEEALLHMISVLKSQGIYVIIITMPYRSEYLQSFSSEFKNYYLSIINKTQCPHYDLTSYSADTEFYNVNHLNFYGRQNVSAKVAEIIRFEVLNAAK